MATKAKFNMDNLALPKKPAVVKTGGDTQALTEKAVETIHKVEPGAEKPAPPQTKKVSFDLPIEYYKFIKLDCLDRDISMREYLMKMIEADYRKRGSK